ncbi:MAG: SAM-dependent methyltransferase, partial [Acidobacteria bacterium]|nr:SAM-dependent methyltransferase [Acidobacteriota bacterium]
HFFTGGQMPADAQMLHFQDHMVVEGHWRLAGTHDQRTAEAWLQHLDRNRAEVLRVLRSVHGDRAPAMANLWRVFFLACAELWGYDRGRQWLVSHYLMRARDGAAAARP